MMDTATSMKSLFRPKSSPKSVLIRRLNPKVIQDHFKDIYGIRISYMKAYRGRERAIKFINGSHEEAYSRLPKYCEEIQHSNPGSTVQLDVDPTTRRFKRVFISFAASAMGFAYCRPLLGLGP
jgi:zinc finger SWIM domain-containing protein 3